MLHRNFNSMHSEMFHISILYPTLEFTWTNFGCIYFVLLRGHTLLKLNFCINLIHLFQQHTEQTRANHGFYQSCGKLKFPLRKMKALTTNIYQFAVSASSEKGFRLNLI